MSARRIPGYGRIDPDKPIVFTFDGKSYRGRAGDSVASALLANGVHLMARSFKYHRPRGVVTAGSEEPNALMSSSRGPGRTEPNSRATMLEIWDGLAVGSQNCWPSLAFDVGVINDKLSRFLAAGFYYKTFMKPKILWEKVYEPVIRNAAGIGVAPQGKGSRSLCRPLLAYGCVGRRRRPRRFGCCPHSSQIRAVGHAG